MPNIVITEQAVRALHETIVPVGWLVQAPAALTPVQINAARQAAVTLGTTIETKSGQLGLGQISDGATIGGILIALGVLAMTVGLIRSETASDLRTLTATGAGGAPGGRSPASPRAPSHCSARRSARWPRLLASLAWAHSSLTQTFGNVPWADVGLLVIGMPLVGAAAGWLLGGRAPSAVSRQPLE